MMQKCGQRLWATWALAAAMLLAAGCDCAQKSVKQAAAPPAWTRADVQAAITEPAADPAELCPADAALYARIDGLAQWRASGDADPLVAHAWELIHATRPPHVWTRAAERMKLSEAAMTDALLGTTVALIDQRINGRHGVVAMSKVEPAMLAKLPAAMGLKALDEPRTRIGPFAMYRVEDGGRRYLIALGTRWMFITETRHDEQLYKLLSATAVACVDRGLAGSSEPLAANLSYQAMLSRLPRERAAMMFSHNKNGDEQHAVAVVRSGHDVMVHYAGSIPKLEKLLGDAEMADAADFGAMPRSTISAASIGVIPKVFPGSSALDFLLFPNSYAKGVLPKIGPTVVTFLGRVAPEDITPNPGMGAPVLGLAIRLKDPAVALELDRIVRGVHFLLSVGGLELGQSLFGMQSVHMGEVNYHIANFGPVLAQRIKDPQYVRLVRLPSSAGLTKVTFGRIGQWYVVCSQEAYFRRWAEADADDTRRFTQSPEFNGSDFHTHPRLILSAMTQAPQLTALMQEVAAYWKKAGEQQLDQPVKPMPKALAAFDTETEEISGPLDEPMRWVADGLRRTHSFNVQIWREGDTEVRGELHVVPTPVAHAARQ